MLEQLLGGTVFAVLLVFVRVGTAVAFLPGFSAGYVGVNIRLLLGLTISALVAPVLGGRLPAMPATPAALGTLIVAEALIGLFLGTVARVLVAALQTAGTLTAYFASFASALVQDSVADQQSSTIAGFFGTLGVLLIFVTDLHHLMLRAVIDSYAVFTPGALPPLADLAETIVRQATDSFALGLKLSAPFLIVSLTYHVGLGLLGRLMPQLRVFFFGLPVQISV